MSDGKEERDPKTGLTKSQEERLTKGARRLLVEAFQRGVSIPELSEEELAKALEEEESPNG